jgi:hypothetical protein
MLLMRMKWNDMMMVTTETVFVQSVTDSQMWTAQLSPPASSTARPVWVTLYSYLFVPLELEAAGLTVHPDRYYLPRMWVQGFNNQVAKAVTLRRFTNGGLKGEPWRHTWCSESGRTLRLRLQNGEIRNMWCRVTWYIGNDVSERYKGKRVMRTPCRLLGVTV